MAFMISRSRRVSFSCAGAAIVPRVISCYRLSILVLHLQHVNHPRAPAAEPLPDGGIRDGDRICSWRPSWRGATS